MPLNEDRCVGVSHNSRRSEVSPRRRKKILVVRITALLNRELHEPD